MSQVLSPGSTVAFREDIDEGSADSMWIVIRDGVVRETPHGDGWVAGPEREFSAADVVQLHHHEGRRCADESHGEGDGWL